MKNKHIKNKGFTLVELLVAMAVGGVVLSAVAALIAQGVKSYSRQTLSAQLQEEAGMALNHISDSIMEANCIEIDRAVSGGDVLVFTTDSATPGNIYVYDQTNGKLYVGTSKAASDLSLLCSYIDSFMIEVLPQGTGGVVQIEATISLKYENVNRTISRITNVRNKLSSDRIIINDSVGGSI